MISASWSSILMAEDLSFEISRILIKLSESKIVSGSELARVDKIFFSMLMISVLKFAKLIDSCYFYNSTFGFSYITTSTSIYSSSPSNVTVKLMIVNLIHISGRKWGFGILDVKASLKLSSYGTSLSENLIVLIPSFMKTDFWRIESNEASISSYTSSINTTQPFQRENSSSFVNYFWGIFIFKILKSVLYVLLIQVFACVWGSIMRGHL